MHSRNFILFGRKQSKEADHAFYQFSGGRTADDYICTDMPTAMGACATYDNLVILDFTGSDDNFQVDEGEINIGISVVKGNSFLLDAMNKVLGEMNVDMFNTIMDEAIAVQPEI